MSLSTAIDALVQEIPADKRGTLVTGFTAAYKYQPMVDDENDTGKIPNPETPAQFSKRMLSQHLMEIYSIGKQAETEQSIIDIKQAAIAEAQTEFGTF